ncbi:hypothetical protein [Mangrovihabitans endophyticus]|uniref:Uncharacterized protein n=1 Tax=Mangrovihabitans endophyticus TaxID=1751298 RepID=A0A8J3FSR1_9ACTN|nr:hypothetical protein [Mangrovihabitans endophyticus]GGL20934.1 hypothetical protein GCM10012284_64550 [Mangrovihabitans endophyticus]
MIDDLVIRQYRHTDHAQVIALNAYGLAAAGVPLDFDVYAGDLDVDSTYLTARSTLLVGEFADQIVAMSAFHLVRAGRDACIGAGCGVG